jgi:hypothetical protein
LPADRFAVSISTIASYTSGVMDDDVESFVGRWRDEIARKQIVCRFADLIRMLAAFVSLSQSLLADRVWQIEDMQFVGDLSLGYQ